MHEAKASNDRLREQRDEEVHQLTTQFEEAQRLASTRKHALEQLSTELKEATRQKNAEAQLVAQSAKGPCDADSTALKRRIDELEAELRFRRQNEDELLAELQMWRRREDEIQLHAELQARRREGIPSNRVALRGRANHDLELHSRRREDDWRSLTARQGQSKDAEILGAPHSALAEAHMRAGGAYSRGEPRAPMSAEDAWQELDGVKRRIDQMLRH